ncbi:heterokaryon incompatibility protein-domain-containing protein [Dactylonectria macrodidyma]|uniref:Heterokaryon incompatibility protein-domain-containing protein n=1 Tax=Dactylonectria macrodidyma TaxID=307937 RepID=A0A9P9FAK5_9HYPO|nr:heterokaryon incompatibility protein-domain-containing protein [Dactylonectria macrodidyma]
MPVYVSRLDCHYILKPLMSPRLYTRLLEGRIRLLKLNPGSWDDHLEAEIFEADQSLTYIALSYTWGSPVARKEIIINRTGVKGITINLDLALRTIRSPDFPVTLWVDALCINQDDMDDKSQQVNFMHQIFSWAIEVRAYVGNSLDRSHRSYDTQLRKLAVSNAFQFPTEDDGAWVYIRDNIYLLENKEPTELTPHEKCLTMFGVLRALSSSRLYEKLLSTELFWNTEFERMEPKIRHLFEWIRAFVIAPWWDRMWITQEVGVARELHLTYGKVTFSFDQLSNAVKELKERPLVFPTVKPEHLKVLGLLVSKVKKISELRRLQRYKSIAEMQDSQYFQRSLGSPLLWLLRTFRHRQSSEPRDKIYALSRLLRNLSSQPQNIGTSYSTSVAALFCRVSIEIMHETGLFWITSSDLVAKSRDNLPSWVPNWADGFATPDHSNISWRIRLCHNASEMTFAVKVIEKEDPEIMAPSHYHDQLARGAAHISQQTLRGNSDKRTEPFPIDIYGQCQMVSSKTVYLDFENSVHRGIEYTYYQPPVRDFTKVENCLKVPVQYCTSIHHVSEPIAPDLSNIMTIIEDLKVARYKVFPNDWEFDLFGDRLDEIGRTLCFGVLLEFGERVRQQAAWDAPNLAILTHLLMEQHGKSTGRDAEQEENYTRRYREKFMSETMGNCGSCWTGPDEPCQLCRDTVAEMPIPLSAEAWKDARIVQAYQTAIQTGPGHCLLLTREGKLALGPPPTQEGDRIYILTGGLCPYILRRDETPKYMDYPAFQLVGDCFLDGIPKWDGGKLEVVVLV